MDQEIMDILEEKAEYFLERRRELETRLTEYTELKELVGSVYEDFSAVTEENGQISEEVLDEALDLEDELLERFPRGIEERDLEDADGNEDKAGEGVGSVIPGALGELMSRINSIQERGVRLHSREWNSRMKDTLQMYLDLIDTDIEHIEEDMAALEGDRLRFVTLRLLLSQAE